MPLQPFELMFAKIWANGLVVVVAAMASLFLVVKGAIGVPIAGSIPLFAARAVHLSVLGDGARHHARDAGALDAAVRTAGLPGVHRHEPACRAARRRSRACRSCCRRSCSSCRRRISSASRRRCCSGTRTSSMVWPDLAKMFADRLRLHGLHAVAIPQDARGGSIEERLPVDTRASTRLMTPEDCWRRSRRRCAIAGCAVGPDYKRPGCHAAHRVPVPGRARRRPARLRICRGGRSSTTRRCRG